MKILSHQGNNDHPNRDCMLFTILYHIIMENPVETYNLWKTRNSKKLPLTNCWIVPYKKSNLILHENKP